MLRLFPALALVLSLGLAGSGTVSAAPLITVETAPGDDAAIIDGVKRTHAPDPRTKLFEVTAETSGGITVLKGRTDSAEALSDLRAAYYEKYGVSLFVGVGIPIPLLDEELAHDVSIRNEQITTNILDFGEEERPIGQTNYAELRSGSIEVRGQRVRTAPEPAQGARDRRNAQRLDRPRRISPHGTRTTHARPFDGQGAESRRRITANKEKHMTTKVILYFPSDATDKAVTYDLVKRYDLRINILRAEIEAGRSGSLLVELTGEEPMVREGVAYLERNGVTVSPVASKIAYDRDRCIDCGNCALACFPQALTIGAPDWRLHFDPERCIACKLCLKSCPLGLFHIEFTEA